MNNSYEEAKSYIKKYREITSVLIMDLDADIFDNLDKAMDERMEALNNLNKLGLEPSFLKGLCDEFNVSEEDKKLQNIMEVKKESLYREIKRMKSTKAANNGYTTTRATNPMYLSKKI